MTNVGVLGVKFNTEAVASGAKVTMSLGVCLTCLRPRLRRRLEFLVLAIEGKVTRSNNFISEVNIIY
jgi:hypothetical protein